MKTKPHMQKLVKRAFNQNASVKHKRYDPLGMHHEGYWLTVDERTQYIGYSKQVAAAYLQSVIECRQASCSC